MYSSYIHIHKIQTHCTDILRPRIDWRKILKLKSSNSFTLQQCIAPNIISDRHIHPLSTRNNVRKASSAICAKSRNSVDNRPGRVSWQGTGLKNIPPVLSHPCWSHISHISLGRIYGILQELHNRLLVCWLWIFDSIISTKGAPRRPFNWDNYPSHSHPFRPSQSFFSILTRPKLYQWGSTFKEEAIFWSTELNDHWSSWMFEQRRCLHSSCSHPTS